MVSPRTSWVPDTVDTTKPSAARAYDAFLGGGHNFACDREFAGDAEKVFPGVALACRANREFLRRAVLFGLRSGIRQFIDIGSGIPTVGNAHEVAHEWDPTCSVVYADNEAVAVAHSEMLLKDNEHAAVIRRDLREPQALLDDRTTRELIDFDQPVMLLMLALLHFVPDDDDPAGLVRQYADALVPGSQLAITHATAAARPDEMRSLEALYATSSNPATARTPEWITGLFGEYELVEPGAVYASEWRPDDNTIDRENYLFFGGVGIKPDARTSD